MKKNVIIWSIIAVGLVALIVVASVLYSNLSENYKANNIVVLSSSKETEDVSSAEVISSEEESATTSNTTSKENNQNNSSSSKVETSSEIEDVSDDTVDDVYFFDFTVVDENGKNVKLSKFLGKPIVLNFWTSWCGYCKKEMPDFEKAAKAYPDVNFVMVNATCDSRETENKAKKYIADNNFDLDFYFDINKEAVQEYGIRSYPTTYFLDAKGNVISYSAGSLDYNGLVDCIEMAKEGL